MQAEGAEMAVLESQFTPIDLNIDENLRDEEFRAAYVSEMAADPEALIGQAFERSHPFTKCKASLKEYGLDGHDFDRWRPGAWGTCFIPPDSASAAAHALGKVRVEAHGVCRPGRYQWRVFYTQQFTDPGGKEMRKSGLLCKTRASFVKQVVAFPFDFEIWPEMRVIET